MEWVEQFKASVSFASKSVNGIALQIDENIGRKYAHTIHKLDGIVIYFSGFINRYHAIDNTDAHHFVTTPF